VKTARCTPGIARRKEFNVPSWLILVLIGVVLVVLGVATEIGQFLIWIGVIVLVASLVISLVNRRRT
jgi:uncharacterized membrane protein